MALPMPSLPARQRGDGGQVADYMELRRWILNDLKTWANNTDSTQTNQQTDLDQKLDGTVSLTEPSHVGLSDGFNWVQPT